MEKGHCVEQGSAEQVLKSPSHLYTRRLIAAVPHLTGKDRVPAEAAASSSILKVECLVKTYRSGSALFGKQRIVPAVNGVSFDLSPGRTLGVVGESGSGKSSLGRLLIKLLDSDSGSILFEGGDVARLSEAEFRPLRPKIQMIFQDPFASLNPRSTVGQILTVGPIAHVVGNALLPMITLAGMQLPSILTGALVTETVFTWPGMGRLFLDSLGYSDYPVVMGLLIFSAILVVLGNLIADIIIATVDPRIRLG